MGGQSPRQLTRVVLAAVQPHGHRAQPTQRQIRLQPTRSGAGQHAPGPQPLGQRRVGGDRETEQQVGVPADELRGAVHDHARAQGERALQQGSGEGVVHHHERVRRAQRRQVGHVHQRVGRRLEPEQVRAGGGVEGRGGVGDVDQPDRPPAGPFTVGQQGADRAVGVGGRHHPRADGQQVDDGRGGGHPRRERRGSTTLKRPDGVFQGLPAGGGVVAGVLPRAGVEAGREDRRDVQRLTRTRG